MNDGRLDETLRERFARLAKRALPDTTRTYAVCNVSSAVERSQPQQLKAQPKLCSWSRSN